ncbi:MAG TPA: hypothetical protein VHK01_16010, partial [Lacipirellulaceae bacterium]|nr:hypothetical protein [Lacipirellulaceae bacterium]
EMLAGRRRFEGEDAAEVIGAAIHKEPDWTALPPAIAPPVTTVLKCCLEKDPSRRLRDMGDVRLALAGAFESRAHAIDDRAIPARGLSWRAVAVAGAVALAASAATGAAMWMALRPDPPRVTAAIDPHERPRLGQSRTYVRCVARCPAVPGDQCAHATGRRGRATALRDCSELVRGVETDSAVEMKPGSRGNS